MYRFFHYMRILVIIIIVGAVIGAVALYVRSDNNQRVLEQYNRQVTAAVETAIANALNDATRTAEAPLRQYRLIIITPDETLESIARRYRTSADMIRQVNGLAADVESGNGEKIIVPEGVRALDPPRRLTAYTARTDDTLSSVAEENNVPLSILETDNPVLAARGVLPGDIIFVATLL
jgi:LysM repeat protein